ncbi:MAG: hypothetical protein CVU86_03085 [Firmicutes bacterium HGW-Firmicutes-11]|jgi:hypothetical protein|nr:MAG: hypothetical protein CVU86_03085 [Firmicutes bacterium HGW-Firmicutes-11]
MYSSKILDPAFSKYVKDSNRWSMWFASFLAIVALSGFYIYGETSSEMDNPESAGIGAIIACMFLLIGRSSTRKRRRNKTWDGYVTDKKIKKKSKNIGSGSDEHWINVLVYTVTIESEDGRLVHLTADDDSTVYDYYEIGDRVRHHKGLNSFEKYDKSNDTIIFCNACASKNDIKDDLCFRCKCPLLK